MSIAETMQGVVTWLLFTSVSAALYYLGSRATITRSIWSRYPDGFDNFMLCAACAGTWFGFFLGASLGWWRHLPYLGLPGGHPVTVLVVGLCSMVWTPIMADRMALALEHMSVRNYGPEQPQPTAETTVDTPEPGVAASTDDPNGGRRGQAS